MNRRIAARPAQATTINSDDDPASGTAAALAVWVLAAKSANRITVFKATLVIWFFIVVF
jgi:hypothetical protein